MTHTPGKWQAEDRGHRVQGIHFFWLVPDKVSLGSANPADATLAASAPDLLEALEALTISVIELWQSIAPDDEAGAAFAEQDPAMKAARAAIAKARSA